MYKSRQGQKYRIYYFMSLYLFDLSNINKLEVELYIFDLYLISNAFYINRHKNMIHLIKIY